LFEVNAAAEIVRAVTHPDANIIFGAAIDDELEDEIRVTVIAAGFDRSDSPTKPVQRPSTAPTDTKGNRIRDLFGSDETGDATKLDIPDFLK
jgi:cell division protein FtsZ